MNIFPHQINTNREFVNTNQVNNYTYNENNCGNNLVYNGTENFMGFNKSVFCEVKAESGVTYNNNNNLQSAPSRKRSRDSMDELNQFINVPQKHSQLPDIQHNFPVQIQQQQSDIDQIIAQHTKKIRMEIEERQKQQTRIYISAFVQDMMKKLREKDENIQKMMRINLGLQDRVKSLYVENQLWKDLAQSNEATVMSLRCNLEQVLTQVSDDRHFPAEEAESCGSSGPCEEEGDEVGRRRVNLDAPGEGSRLCRKCGERESCVLLLPCRHLCLCTVCGTTLQSTCPVCNTSMNATVHVNVSN